MLSTGNESVTATCQLGLAQLSSVYLLWLHPFIDIRLHLGIVDLRGLGSA